MTDGPSRVPRGDARGPAEDAEGGGGRPAGGPGDAPPRRALVLAAGEGSRLDHDTPKPAYPLLGVPLLARTLFTLQEAGVRRAHVVVGHRAGEVRRSVEALDRLELEVDWIHNDRWKGRNGLSVLAAEPALGDADEGFLLTMADHVFEPALVDDLVAGAAGGTTGGTVDAGDGGRADAAGDDADGGRADATDGHADGRPAAVRLAVDTRPGEVADLEDATKVRTEGGRIEAIAKDLDAFDAVDTGVFLATPELFEALRACEREGDGADGPALSEGVQRLADRGRVEAADVGGRTWQDVDTRRDVEIAERKLLESVRSEEDGPVARHLNRPISTRVSRWLVEHTSVTADQVSVGTLGVGLAAAAFAAVGGYAAHLAAGVLFQAASVLDGTDGEVAKLTFRSSKRGAWVDTICDNLAYLAFLVGLTVGAHRMGLPDFFVHTGLLAVGAATVSMAAINLHLLVRDESGSARDVEYGYQERDDLKSRVMQALHYLGKRDMLAMLVLVLAVAGQLHWGLPVFGVAAAVLMVPATGKAMLSAVREARGEEEADEDAPPEAPGREEAQQPTAGDAAPAAEARDRTAAAEARPAQGSGRTVAARTEE